MNRQAAFKGNDRGRINTKGTGGKGGASRGQVYDRMHV